MFFSDEKGELNSLSASDTTGPGYLASGIMGSDTMVYKVGYLAWRSSRPHNQQRYVLLVR